MRSLIILAALILLSACISKHELATCKGPVLALNADQWRPSPAEWAELEKLCPEGK